MKKKGAKWVIGIDEAGRGPIAGPVAVGICALAMTELHILRGIKESKQISEKKREEWFEKLTKRCEYTVVLVGNKIIDRSGITWAIRKAITRGLSRLNKKPDDCLILLDGLLHAPKKYKNQKTIIGGDASTPIIAAASILAKVTRDRKMVRLSKKFPQYGLEVHKGYGTKGHYKALKKYGLCPIHRKSFLKLPF